MGFLLVFYVALIHKRDTTIMELLLIWLIGFPAGLLLLMIMHDQFLSR